MKKPLQMRRRGIKLIFISSSPAKGEAGFSTRHPDKPVYRQIDPNRLLRHQRACSLRRSW